MEEVDTIFERRDGGASFLSALPLLFSVRVFWELIKFRIETLCLAELPAPALQGAYTGAPGGSPESAPDPRNSDTGRQAVRGVASPGERFTDAVLAETTSSRP